MIVSLFSPKRDLFVKASAILITISSIAGFFHFGVSFYLVLGFWAIIIISHGRLRYNSIAISLFLIICLLSLVLNNPPSYFNSWSRLGVYVCVLLCVSPIIVGPYVDRFRAKLFVYILDTCVILSIGSLIAYYLGINLMTREGELQSISSGRFSGLMSHSMFLGPVSSLSATYLLAMVFAAKKKIKKYLYAFLTLCCFAASLLSASRIGLSCGIVGCLVLIIRYYRNNLSRGVLFLVIIIGLGASTFPLWQGYTDFIVEKQLGNKEMGSIAYSREKKIQARLSEFRMSPIIGIGFCTIDPSLDVVNTSNGQIEPGSSWLELLSMTGLMGFVIFIYIALKAMIQAWKIPDKLSSSLLVGFLCLFFVHMLAEGWILSPRAFLNFVFWLTVSCIDNYPNLNDRYIIMLQNE